MTKVALVQFDDRPDDKLGPMAGLRVRNAHYAQQRGYHYHYARDLERNVPAYWNKVFLVQKFLAEGFDTVAWLDSDAVVHDWNRGFESLIPGDEAFVFAGDLPLWAQPSPINAGVFFCKGAFGRAVMDEWAALYPADLWKQSAGQWNVADHTWAGSAFEQGSFAEKLFPRYAGHPAFRQLSWRVLQSPYPQAESFTLHFPNTLRTNCALYLRQLAELAPKP